jgi:ribose-phosphate pyrophosphokinase
MLLHHKEDFNYGGIKLFAGRSHPALANDVAAFLGIPLSKREIVQFPNENLFVKLSESVRGKDVFVLQTGCSPVSDNILEMLIMIDALRRGSAARITVVMPYMPYGRSDKKDQPRVPITARLMADLIQTAGADRYITIDLHAGQIQGFFSIPGDEITSFHLLSDYLADKKATLRDPTIVTADLGFAKKGRNFAAKLNMPMAFVEKRRTGNDATSEVMTVIGDVEDRDVMIVDDEISTAGSMKNTVQVVKDHGARDVYVSCTHPVFVGPAIERLRALPIKELIVTNTVPTPDESVLPNIKVLSVAPLLGEVIMRVHDGRSVGEMFNE